MVRVDIETIVMAAGPVPSLIVLRERSSKSDSPAPLRSLSIQTGSFEAAAISRGIDSGRAERPITHDLLLDTVGALGPPDSPDDCTVTRSQNNCRNDYGDVNRCQIQGTDRNVPEKRHKILYDDDCAKQRYQNAAKRFIFIVQNNTLYNFFVKSTCFKLYHKSKFPCYLLNNIIEQIRPF